MVIRPGVKQGWETRITMWLILKPTPAFYGSGCPPLIWSVVLLIPLQFANDYNV